MFHESTATARTNYQPIVVHGLLQTEDYARAMIRLETWRSPESVENCVRARMDRQMVLNRARHVFYLHEQALRLRVGSDQLMHEQLLKLVLFAVSDLVTIQVVPLVAGERSVFGNSFSLLDYDGARSLLYLDYFASGVFVEDPDSADPYVRLVPSIARVALDARRSQELLMAIARDYEHASGGQTD